MDSIASSSRARLRPLVVVLAALSFAACGGGGSKKSSRTTPAPPRPSFSSWFTAAGSLETRYFPPAWLPFVGTAADLDGDGNVDLATPAGIAWGDFPSRAFVAGPALALEDPGDPAVGLVSTIAVGDVDGDGDLDLMVARDGVDALLLQGPVRTFTDVTAARMPQAIESTWDVALADLDGDGDLDALLARSAQNAVLDNQAGTFVDVTATRAPVASDSSAAVAVGDVDGDGDLDALWGNHGQNTLWLNTGNGAFVAAAGRLPIDTEWTFDVALADGDGDGDLDAFRTTSQGIDVLANDGGGHFSQATTLPQVAVSHLLVADENGDGLPDLAAADEKAAFGLWRNTGGLTFAQRNGLFTPIARWTEALDILGWADVDHDGRPDVIASTRHGVQITFPRGTGYWTHPVERAVLTEGASGTVVGDVDGDGDLDLVVAGSNRKPGESAAVLLNDGDGTLLQDGTRLPASAQTWLVQELALADVDGDGDLDLLTGTGRSLLTAPPTILANDGHGVFGTPIPLPAAEASEVFPFDADLDGDVDLLLLGSSTRLLVNDGTGTFADETAQRLPASPPSVVAHVADVDGDGIGELLVLDDGNPFAMQNPRVLQWRNDGHGVFRDVTAQTMPPGGQLPQAMADFTVGDLDADGDLDAVVAEGPLPAASAPQVVARVLWNDGRGAFTVGPHLSSTGLSGDYGAAVAVADADLDGFPEVFVHEDVRPPVSMTPSHVQMFWNQAGTFALAGTILDTDTVLEPADVDGDGDPDLVIGSTTLINQLRDVRAATLPIAGASLVTTIRQPAGTFVPLVAVAGSSTPLGALGVLRLDPTNVIALPPVPVPASGTATLTLALPPAASALPLFLQGLHVESRQPQHLGRPILETVW